MAKRKGKSINDINYQLSRIKARYTDSPRVKQAESIGEIYKDNVRLSKAYSRARKQLLEEGWNNKTGSKLGDSRMAYSQMYANQELKNQKFSHSTRVGING